MPATCEVLVRIRYAECDAQGVVFNGRYGELADVAATELFRHCLGGYQQMLDQGLDNQVVHYSIDWKAPIRFDEVILIRAQVDRVGTSSLRVRIDFEGTEGVRKRAQAQLVYVMVTATEFRKISVPGWLADRALADGPAHRIDMAGSPEPGTRLPESA